MNRFRKKLSDRICFVPVCFVVIFLVIIQSSQAQDFLQKVKQISGAIAPNVIEWRRYLHEHPELSNRETETAEFVADRLREIGVDDLKTGIAHHGVVALIQGKQPGPCVALRADMDALPVTEQTGLPFVSQVPGVMHACGHDIHTSILLGAAQVLAAMRDQIPGSIKLVFQPAEEGAPDGEEGGASLMIKEGVMNNPTVSAFFGQHIDPNVEVGKIGYIFGGSSASSDEFTITVKGKQVHAAYPWDGIDPIVASAQIVMALQTIASRIIDTRETVVVTMGTIHGGNRSNIIPEEVTMKGTIRTHKDEVRAKVMESLKRIAQQTADANGAIAEVKYDPYGPVLRNDPDLGKTILPVLAKIVGQEQVIEGKPLMSGEDFAYYAQKVPAFFIRLGIRNEKIGAIHPLHSPNLLVDEDCIPVGIQAMSMMALDYLGNN